MSDTAHVNEDHLYEVEVIQTRIVKYFVKAKDEDEVSERVLNEEFFYDDESLTIEIIEETNDSVASVVRLG